MWLTRKRIRDQGPSWLKATALAAAGLAALYVGVRPVRDSQETTGLSRASWTPQSYWRQERLFGGLAASQQVEAVGVVGSIPQTAELASTEEPAPPAAAPDDSDRKMVRTDSIDLVAQHPAETAEQISQLATRLGGFLVTSEVSGDPDTPNASLTIRVPAARFDEARAEIRKLGLRVDDERIEAQDVTRQYVDQEAHLRNLRAEEQQYLAILKHAATVKDTLEVSEKLSEVRGEIEQQQAEFDTLSKQVETVAITVSLRAESDTKVLGLNWRPLYRLKVAARNGLDGIGDFIASVTALAFYLPAILLWLAAILTGAALGWRLLRWGARVLFSARKPAIAQKEAH